MSSSPSSTPTAHTRTSYLLVYDIRRPDNALRLRVNRRLKGLGASRLQHSVWELDRLDDFLGLATLMRSAGGKALILEKRVVLMTHVCQRSRDVRQFSDCHVFDIRMSSTLDSQHLP